MTTLSVVIPAYNEEQGIEEIIQRVFSVEESLREVGVDELELLVVDDGSRDRTAEIIARNTRVQLIRHPINRGYGAALKTGFSNARGEIVGFLDADGTYPPEHFPDLCLHILAGNDLVVGSRMSGASSQMPPARRIGNLFFASLLTLVGRQKVTDSASGMRVFKREVMDIVYPLPDGLNLTPVMSARALHEDLKMREVPIPYSERIGRSKLNVIRDGLTFLQSILWTALNYNPVRILGLIGMGGVAFTLLVGLGLVIARLSGITSLGPWGVAAAFWALVSGVSGVSLFALGATFNYLVSLLHKRPIRQGLFGRPLFRVSIDRSFGWIGLAAFTAGLMLSFTSLVLGARGWEISRLWLYLTGSAMLILMGIQMTISWILMRVLEELSQRETLSNQDSTRQDAGNRSAGVRSPQLDTAT